MRFTSGAAVELFGVDLVPSAETADAIYDQIAACVADPQFRPRALLDRFKIEVISTTDPATSELRHHVPVPGARRRDGRLLQHLWICRRHRRSRQYLLVDLFRRVDAGYLVRLVLEHRLSLDEALEIAIDLTYNLPKESYPRP